MAIHAAATAAQSDESPRPAPEIGKDRSANQSPRVRTILVVEDDPDVGAIVEELLSDNGYRVLRASDGKEALEHLRSAEAIDLMFTDVVMPGGMNGRDVAAAAGEIRPGLRVLFTSGYLGHTLAGGSPALAPRPFLAKPYRPGKLLDMIRGMITD